jgi:adenylosuccinate synthase
MTISPLCPIITPLEVLSNQCDDDTLGHGTCGHGINATLRREEDHHSILARDLLYPEILKAKLKALEANYYDDTEDFDPGEFLYSCDDLIRVVSISDNELLLNVIYEGSQGLMLDKDIGIFPNVTPYNVGMMGVGSSVEEAFYVTRAYNTRHGNGPMFEPPDADGMNILDNPWEKNHTNKFQGKFRKGMLNADTLEYALQCDDGYLVDDNILVITCLEHIPQHLEYYYGGMVHKFETRVEFCNSLAGTLGMDKYVMCVAHEFGKITGVV